MSLSFYGKKNRVVIGVHGSMAIGYTAAWFLISAAEFGVISPITAPWLIALILLNALRVMFKRALLGVSLYRSDREHIHHFFLDNNYSRRFSLLIILLISSSIAFIGIIFQIGDVPETISFFAFLGIFVIWSFLSYSLNKKIEKEVA